MLVQAGLCDITSVDSDLSTKSGRGPMVHAEAGVAHPSYEEEEEPAAPSA